MGMLVGDREDDKEHQNLKQDPKNAEIKKNQRQSLDMNRINDELEIAKDDWDDVEDVTFVYASRNATTTKPSISFIPFNEAMEYFRSHDMSEYMIHIVPVITYSGMASIKRKLWGPPCLNSSLENSRNLLFAIASCPLQNSVNVHMRVLQTIYKKLTNSKRDAARCGTHWDFIGFQGCDPATDLRGVGFLGLMHLLYFVMEPSMLPLAKAILKLSHHSTQNFPFAVMGINITRIVLQSLREERLNKECNKAHDVVSVTNMFYVGVFLHLYETWQKKHLTIKDSGWVLKGIENTAKRKPKLVFQRLKNYLVSQESLTSQPASSPVILTKPSAQLTALPVPLSSVGVDTTPRICHMEPYPICDDDSESVDSGEAEVPSSPCTVAPYGRKADTNINSTTTENTFRGEDKASYSANEFFI